MLTDTAHINYLNLDGVLIVLKCIFQQFWITREDCLLGENDSEFQDLVVEI